MANSRYEELFRSLKQRGEGAFTPFVVAGDPNPLMSSDIMSLLAESGADAIEIGLPFSDPVADGQAIQKADLRSLQGGMTPSSALKLIAELRRKFPMLPIGLLVYANIIEAVGMSRFYAAAFGAGIDSVLAADVPTFEAEPYVRAACENGIEPVFIAAGNSSDAQLRQIASLSKGYTYVVTRAGVTGAELSLHPQASLIRRMQSFGAPPCLLGFGISTPEQVRVAMADGAAGAISGSAIANIIEKNLGDPDAMLGELSLFTKQMKAATK